MGLMSAMRLYAPDIVSRGKNALEKNSRTKSKGNAPCTASAEPVRIATDDMIDPMARATIPPETDKATMPTTPDLTGALNGNNSKMKISDCAAPKIALPARRPIKMPLRVLGERSKRSKKPFSISVASAAAPVTEPRALLARRLTQVKTAKRIQLEESPECWLSCQMMKPREMQRRWERKCLVQLMLADAATLWSNVQ